MIMRYGEKGKCWSTYLDYCLRHKTISFNDSQLSRTKQKKILSKVREIVKERLSRDFANEPMTPAPADRNVFSNADEFPPLPQAAAALQAPPLATPTKAQPRATPMYTKAAQASPLALPKTPPSTPPTTRPPPQRQAQPQLATNHPPKQPSQQQSTATPQSPTVQWPAPRRNPQEIQLRPQRVAGGQQVKQQVTGSAQPQQLLQRQSPSSPKSAQPVHFARPGVQQSRPGSVHPRALGQTTQQPPRSQVVQQPRSSITQQPRSPVAQHARPPRDQQVHAQPQITQPRPLAANARLSRQPEAPMLGGGGGSRKPAVKPSKLSLASHTTWGNQQSGLAPGAIESPAEFPPLGAAPAGKRQQQQQPGAHQGKRKERQVPSNSIRDLSARQARRTEEMTYVEGKSLSAMNDFVILLYSYSMSQMSQLLMQLQTRSFQELILNQR